MDRYWLPALIIGLTFAQEEKEVVRATFKGTRLYNFHTSELLPARHLEFRVGHRFGDMRQGYRQFFGIDAGAQVRVSFAYGIHPRAEIGIERTGTGKWWNTYLKVRFFSQTSPTGLPFSLTWLGSAFLTEQEDRQRYSAFLSRMEYFQQLMLARKFSARFSALLALLWLHQNMALTPEAPNDWFWGLMAMRYKVSHRIVLWVEGALPLWSGAYAKVSHPLPSYQIPAAAGIEIDTGGHLFQIGLTNADGLSENQNLLTTRPLLRFGFNISRTFSFQSGLQYGTRE
ncbi:MAG: DUF5777 family beta-barrel protein [Bacteroidia bacterium]|nr:DUF5777 family beta-barrel protein [Bacteroidia bacterium]MDW8236298.1 DUF5777 family beta-barrel protein [Bacteroidia bacterium]